MEGIFFTKGINHKVFKNSGGLHTKIQKEQKGLLRVDRSDPKGQEDESDS